jgi:hypothetical protein
MRCSGCSAFSCKCKKTQLELPFDLTDAKEHSAALHLRAVKALTEELADANKKLYDMRILLKSMGAVLNGN